MSVVGQLGSVVGCAGLALLYVATRRDLRLAGLAGWFVGLAGLAAYLAPDLGALELGAAAVAGIVAAALGGWALLRFPYLLAFATLACVPIRIPVQLGDEDANLLVPLYLVVSSLAVALGWELVVRRDKRDRELGPVALPLAAFVAWTGLTLVWSVDLREGAIFVGAFVLPSGCSRSASPASPGAGAGSRGSGPLSSAPLSRTRRSASTSGPRATSSGIPR